MFEGVRLVRPWLVGVLSSEALVGSLWLSLAVLGRLVGWLSVRPFLALSGSYGRLSVRLSLSALVGCPESFVGSLAVVPWLVGRLVGLLCLSRLLPCLPRLLLVVVVLAVLA